MTTHTPLTTTGRLWPSSCAWTSRPPQPETQQRSGLLAFTQSILGSGSIFFDLVDNLGVPILASLPVFHISAVALK